MQFDKSDIKSFMAGGGSVWEDFTLALYWAVERANINVDRDQFLTLAEEFFDRIGLPPDVHSEVGPGVWHLKDDAGVTIGVVKGANLGDYELFATKKELPSTADVSFHKTTDDPSNFATYACTELGSGTLYLYRSAMLEGLTSGGSSTHNCP